ncbi:UNVERIFIED_CONTAM: hypothetical protein KB580_01940 [Streptococcus canis]|uniref:hypothetical protein n=1 Tax=Streptococcus canis TaxID=1329 RepID=UPI00294A1625|nr:hypothetical protein [Streptococcus canis]MDV6000682.1 hypothetical protein [Streptococcus canis]
MIDNDTLAAVHEALQLSMPKIISMIKEASINKSDDYKKGLCDGADLIGDTILKSIGQIMDSEADHD